MKPNDKAIEAAIRYLEAPMSAREQMEKILTAAYAAQLPPSGDYAGLIERLRQNSLFTDSVNEELLFLSAADALESVLAERDALNFELAARKEWPQARAEMLDELAKVRAERDALAARFAPVEDEELVEIAATAYLETHSDKITPVRIEAVSPYIRAAIAAIRPHIEAAERERCAKIAESHKYPMKTIAGTGYNNAAKEIAAAIRRGK